MGTTYGRLVFDQDYKNKQVHVLTEEELLHWLAKYLLHLMFVKIYRPHRINFCKLMDFLMIKIIRLIFSCVLKI
jgi:hypothetical protein